MKKIFSIAQCLLITSLFSFSQKENNIWYFGDHAGMDFNNGSPVALTNSAMFTYDNCTSVADAASGSLLFYSNGVNVWNKNHTVMPNGNGLLGNTTGGNSALAIRQPGSTAKYYLFTNDAFAGSNGLRYSVIDMSLNGGWGDVTSTKNVLLLNPSTEKITAVKHSNGQDIWIVTHPWNSNEFNVYLLSNTGLNTTPIVSTIGSIHSGGTLGTYNSVGQISASSKGNKIIVAIYDLQQYELFDFDNNTGSLSNLITINSYPTAWGAEFSLDGNKLYTTQWNGSGSVYQFDLSSNNQNTINSSATVIGNVTGAQTGYLQLAPDGKVYLAKYTSYYLGVINSPNILGPACNFSSNGFYLGSKISEAGLPAFLQTNTLYVTANSTTVCLGSCSTLNATPGGGTTPYTYLWNPGGQTTSSIIICPTSSSSYTIAVTDALGTGAISIATCNVTPNPVANITGPSTVCSGATITLTASGGISYIWNTNSTTSSIVIAPTSTSNYTITVTDGNGCTDKNSVTVNVDPSPTVNAGSDISICAGTITTLNATGNGTYTWSPSIGLSCISCANPSANPSTTTTYVVTATNSCGSISDPVTITINSTPSVNAGPDQTICAGGFVTLPASGSGTYSWSPPTGLNCTSCPSPLANPLASTNYTVTIASTCGTAMDSVWVFVNKNFAGISTNSTICIGNSSTLIATGGTSYIWNTGDTGSTINVTPSSTSSYSVLVNSGGCIDTASTIVIVNPIPTANAGNNVTITIGQSTVLSVSGEGTYLWSNGSIDSIISVSPSLTTVYCVTVTNANSCSDSSCVIVSVIPIDCASFGELYLPTAFSPNSDNENDEFQLYYGNFSCIKSFNINIYNRYGEKVFDSSDPGFKWDGSYQGQKLDPATFAYYAKVTMLSGKDIVKKGNVSIIK